MKDNNIFNKIEESNDNLKTLINLVNISRNNKDKYKTMYQENNKLLTNRLITMGVSLALIITSSSLIEQSLRKKYTHQLYDKITEIYSTLNGEVTTSKEIVNQDFGKEVYIKLYNGWNNPTSERTYQEYDVSEYDFDNAIDYYNYGIYNYEIIPVTKGAKMTEGTNSLEYYNMYTEVEMTTYEYRDKYFDKDNYLIDMGSAYVLYIIFLLSISSIFKSVNNESLISKIFNLKELVREIKYKNESKKGLSKEREFLNKEINEIIKEINKNNKYRDELMVLYEENIFLLTDPGLVNKVINYVFADNIVNEAKNIGKKRELIIK